jgi:hypothetical protein
MSSRELSREFGMDPVDEGWNVGGTRRPQAAANADQRKPAKAAQRRDSWRRMSTNGNVGRGTVTPEVAGSSPVAPVKPLQIGVFSSSLVRLGGNGCRLFRLV